MKISQAILTLSLSRRPLFSIGDIKKLLAIKKSNTAYKLIQRLIKNGILKTLIKGKYQLLLKTPNDFEVANFLYQPSYISLESALNLYGILTQGAYEVISLTPRRNKTIIIDERKFIYLHISPRFYCGFQKEKGFLIASKEKALFDELYFISKGLRRLALDELDLSGLNLKAILTLTKRLKNPRLKRLLKEIKKS